MLRLTTFGGLGLSRDGAPVTGAAAQRSRLALLALLATAGPAGVSRDKLVVLLWSESDVERARHALKQAVYALRRELGDVDFISGTASLSLNAEHITSDIQDFDAAFSVRNFAAAAALYSGPFLDGVHLRDSGEFERWCDEHRERYARLRATAVEQLARECETRGGWRDAANHWRTLAAAEPYSGQLAHALILALAESGDTAAALTQYRVHETLLHEEVGTAPEPTLTSLANALRAGKWHRTAPTVSTAVIQTQAPDSGEAGLVQTLAAPPAAVAPLAQRTGTRRKLVVGSALGLLALGAAALAIPYAGLDANSKAAFRTIRTRPAAALDPRQIVVAPFENKTGDPSLDVLGEQIADWFARELSEAEFAVVDARTARLGTKIVDSIPAVLRPRDRHIALGQETGSAYAVVGSYYKQGDTLLEANISVIDVRTQQARKMLGPFHGSRRNADAFIVDMLKPTVGYLASDVDTSAGALTLKYSSPPSLEAFTRMSRAWERFFESPRDTATVFAELDSAANLDSTYATPLLMKAFMLDSKSRWPDVAQLVARVRPLVPNMSRLDKAAFDLLETDLRGDALARLGVAQRLRKLSPGSGEMPLLLVVSSLYTGRTGNALQALSLTDPNRGVNLVAPTYLEWGALAQHAAGNLAAEEKLAREMLRRFSHHPPATLALVMFLARRNDKALRAAVNRGYPAAKGTANVWIDTAGNRLELMLLAGRELRAHGHLAAADSFFHSLAAELQTLPSTATIDQLRRQAHAFYESRDFARAARAFAQIVARDSLDIESEGRLATSAVRMGDTATAERIDRKLAALNRPYLMGFALRWRANIAAVRGRHEQAVLFLERAVRQGHRLIDTPIHLNVHQDVDYLETQLHPAFAAMFKSLAESPTR